MSPRQRVPAPRHPLSAPGGEALPRPGLAAAPASAALSVLPRALQPPAEAGDSAPSGQGLGRVHHNLIKCHRSNVSPRPATRCRHRVVRRCPAPGSPPRRPPPRSPSSPALCSHRRRQETPPPRAKGLGYTLALLMRLVLLMGLICPFCFIGTEAAAGDASGSAFGSAFGSASGVDASGSAADPATGGLAFPVPADQCFSAWKPGWKPRWF